MYDFTNTAPVVGITGYNTLAPNDQDAVMTHLAEVDTALESSPDAPMTATLLLTTPCSWLATALTLPRAMMSSTCAASAVFSSTSLGLLAPTTLPCLEQLQQLLNKTSTFWPFFLSFFCLLVPTTLPCLELLTNKASTC